ncbi:MAG: hypothetical protein NC037_05310 [Bacteroides sp.]|nr:hypothetical protein [Bacillota bacterium]MCM1394183.1 hypothetical protein [[Eubacterium] siraeum]MCM1455924.1 hypothetical protein [Bacteroides sp.]
MSDSYNKNNGDEFDSLAESVEGNQIFRRFKRKSVAAKEWIQDLIKNGYRSNSGRSRRAAVGLFMSDEMQDVGVLSLAPSLSALLFEISLLKDSGETDVEGVSFEDVLLDDKALPDNKLTVLNVVTDSICKLLAECYPDGVYGGRGKVLLSSMPFYDESATLEDDSKGWKKNGYLDSASWVFLAADSIEAFLDRLERTLPSVYKKVKWDIKNTLGEVLTVDEVREAVRTLYLQCIKVTCDCIIMRGDKVLGWSFKDMDDDETDPSLYFSYVASTVYLGLYKRFDRQDNTIGKLRYFEKQLSESGEIAGKYRFFVNFGSKSALEKTINWLVKNNFKEFAAYLSNLSESELAELDLLYNKINNGQPLTYRIDKFNAKIDRSAAFTALKESTMELAETLWYEGFGSYRTRVPFKKNMAKGPCFEDGTQVDMEIVRLSSHNNAFFNNLFVIGIILNSAYDAELERTNPDEYDKMLNIFQLSIQNTQRCYNEIESEGLLYKIDSYILDFSDKVDDENVELAKQLRKVNMAAVPLLPLMLKNNNLMSEYVVRYPQKQMTESLKDIIRNKKRKNGVSSWVWDKDGYNAITNYYYIDALISFYRYYEQYEERFIASEERAREIENRAIKQEQEKAVTALRNKENEYTNELRWRDEYIAQTRELCKGIARLVINGLIDLVDEQLTDENLLGGLDSSERVNRDKVIDKLNSFDKDTDAVKVSKLVHVSEKLQLLSLLSMENNTQLNAFLKTGDPIGQKNAHDVIIRNVFGQNGNSSKFMLNLITYLASMSMGTDNKNN